MPAFTGDIGYVRGWIADDGHNPTFDALTLRATRYLNDRFGFQAEGALGVSTDHYHRSGFDIATKLEWTVAGYAVATLPVSGSTNLIGRAGYAVTRVSASAGFGSASANQDGPAIGVGVRQNIGGTSAAIGLDYARHFYDDHGYSAFSLVISKRF